MFGSTGPLYLTLLPNAFLLLYGFKVMQKTMLQYITQAKWTRLWYGGSFLLLILSLILTNYVTGRLLNQSNQISRTDAVINNLEQTIGYVKDAETGVRGYIIMKDSSFLEPFSGSRRKIDSVYQLLQRQTNDDAYQQRQLQNLQTLTAQRYQSFGAALDTFVKHNYEVSIFSKQRLTSGKRLMDSLRRLVSGMQQHERIEMEDNRWQLRNIYYVVVFINIATIVISILLAFYAFRTFNRENRARQEADRKATDYRRRLETRVVELRSANMELNTLRSNEKFASTGRIARTIAHEVRNPLTNINLAIEQLEEDTADIPGADIMIDMVKRNSLRIHQLITDLLSSTRFAELNFEKVQLHSLLNQSLADAQDRIGFQQVQVIKEYSAEMPDIKADGEKLKVAFLNIILNALEAVQPGKGILTISTATERNYCLVSIRDNGTGMSKETLQRLFEPYFTRKEKGNGLGLTNTQNIILNHKGTLHVESEEGSGTTFTIRLPFAP
jgi:signal transduction histidine kinase